jgi:N-acyl-D-amino-acid deacylase
VSDYFDLLIRGGTLIDGTGGPRRTGDVAVRGDRIVRMGDLAGAKARLEIDATGKAVAPGFIDAHTHDDRLLLSAPEMTPKVSQGVTTVVAGNCGVSLAPFPGKMAKPVTPPLDLLDDSGDWFRFETFAAYVGALHARPPATNTVPLVGHTTLRVATMSDLERPATPAEIERMQALVTEALEAGAFGVSTGLYYEPAAAAPTEEVIQVCQSLREYQALYCTHLRDEADRVLEALEEALRIGRGAGAPVVISHHKVNGVRNHGRSRETLDFLAARMPAQPIALDCYPYCASSTVLSADRAAVATRTVVTWSKPHPECAGRDLSELAQQWGVSQADAARRLLPAGAIYFSMAEEDVQRILAFAPTMIGSDGLPHDAFPHPRLWSTFPRVLGHYVRSVGLFSLEQAVHKMTGLTARNYGLAGRGELAADAYADITVFDPDTVEEVADFEYPVALAAGIATVIVNGAIVWHQGHATGARPGRVLRRAAAHAPGH